MFRISSESTCAFNLCPVSRVNSRENQKPEKDLVFSKAVHKIRFNKN